MKLKALRDFVAEHPEVFETFGEIADEFNEALQHHVKALKAEKSESALFRMTVPHIYVCPDVEKAKEVLGASFGEYFETKHALKTAAVRNALSSNPEHQLKDLVAEVEDTPRHEGPKPINISAIKAKE